MADVLTERHGATLLVTLNRPESKNSVAGRMLAEILEAFTEAAEDDSIRVVVTTGAGSTYCVGMDLQEADGQLERAPVDVLNDDLIGGDKGIGSLSRNQRLLEPAGGIGRWTRRIAGMPKPTVAALNGVTAGGGLAFAVLQDFRVAAANARLTPGFLGVGVAPEMGMTYFLPRLLGWRAANQLLLRNPVLGAEEAAGLGLVDQVAPEGRALPEAMELAEQLARLPTVAMQATKQLLSRSAASDLDGQLAAEYQAQLTLFGLPETRTAIAELRARLGRRG
ncbi:enoyl-CoA hydratase/isomerase family protein [Pseudonocardia spinosispora]|uniref:enoyl-CoA hydratase/isomerase family protein n=1 Tax=Pseudonocardia spinosispora TaxID=103441 RepID=UPI00040B255A|nr:enoyl-CoA hydratase-related protein [Pseudonocardia spinosispora]